jgi:glycosyltransferase involved in cell wall biosynthesis
VLHVADVVNRYDFIDNVVRALDRGRFWVGVCTLGRAANIADPAYGDAGIPHWDIPAVGRRSYAGAALKLARLLRQERVDVVHVHHYEPTLVAWLATRLAPKTRLVVGRHYSDAIYLASHGTRRRVLLLAEAIVHRAASRIVVPSTMIRSLLVDLQDVPATKVLVVPYGFDPARYKLPDDEEVRSRRDGLGLDGHFTVGTFARLYADKGHAVFLDALSSLGPRLPHLQWLVIGEGPERQAIEEEIVARGLTDVVRLLGWRSDVLELMRAVDIVVQPTLQEAFSQVMAEALWMGRPLVMTDVSAAADVIIDGSTGLLVPPGDAEALAAAVARLAADEGARARLAEAGRAFATERLTIASIISRYEDVYLDTCAERGHSRGTRMRRSLASGASLARRRSSP